MARAGMWRSSRPARRRAYAYNCVAFGCKVNGVTQNSHRDGEVVINCLAFANSSSGYNYFF